MHHALHFLHVQRSRHSLSTDVSHNHTELCLIEPHIVIVIAAHMRGRDRHPPYIQFLAGRRVCGEGMALNLPRFFELFLICPRVSQCALGSLKEVSYAKKKLPNAERL